MEVHPEMGNLGKFFTGILMNVSMLNACLLSPQEGGCFNTIASEP